MDCWRILGIKKTNDRNVIKKAYAGLLREHKPDSDAEGYQLVREAYDAAIAQAKSGSAADGDQNAVPGRFVRYANIQNDVLNRKRFHQDDDKKQSINANQKTYSDNKNDDKKAPCSVDISEVIENFMLQVSGLYKNYSARLDLKNWKNLFNNECLLNLDVKAAVDYRMLGFLVNHHYLPSYIFDFINSFFGWGQRELDIEKEYPFFEKLLQQLSWSTFLHYNVFLSFSKPDDALEQYFSLREHALEAYFDNNLSYSRDCIEQALEIYSDDPELLYIAGDCYRKLSENTFATKAYSHIPELSPDYVNGYYFCSDICFNSGDYNTAFEFCKKLLKLQPDNFEALCIAGRCRMRVSDTYGAITYFNRAKAIRGYDLEPIMFLSEIYSKRLAELKKNSHKKPFDSAIQKEIADINYGISCLTEKPLSTKDLFSKSCDLMSVYSILVLIVCIILLFFNPAGSAAFLIGFLLIYKFIIMKWKQK